MFWNYIDPSKRVSFHFNTTQSSIFQFLIFTANQQYAFYSVAQSRKFDSTKFLDSLHNGKNGKKYGSGYIVLYETLKNHNNYLERILKAEGKCSQRKRTPANKARFLVQAKLEAVNCRPGKHPEGENDIIVEEKRVNLLNLHNHVLQIGEAMPPPVHDEIETALSASFKTIRESFNYIHDIPTSDTVYLSWPVLFRWEYLCYLYYLQMGHSVQFLRDNLNTDRLAIFAFGRAFNLTTADTSDNDYDALDIIFKYFGENIQHLVEECPVSLNFKILFLRRKRYNIISKYSQFFLGKKRLERHWMSTKRPFHRT